MKQILLICAVVALAGCGESAEEQAAKAKTKAQAGDTEAQFVLGDMYRNGRGVKQDFKEAVKWFRKASEQGYAEAQYDLGLMYYFGRGVERDIQESKTWMRKAAEQGNADAQNFLKEAQSIDAEPTPAEKAAAEQVAADKATAIKKVADEAQANAFVNTLGMKFVPVKGTEVASCIWETRVKDYAEYAAANAGVNASWKKPFGDRFKQANTHPVVNVSWEDANAFCEWLTKKELAEGKIKAGQKYRLPTDAEWSVAVGLGKEKGNTPEEKHSGIKDVYPWGKGYPPPVGAGNFHKYLKVDKFDYTAPTGSFASNKDGLHDMGGNVLEWCEDKWSPTSSGRVLRGASWFYLDPDFLLSSYRRDRYTPDYRNDDFGFRCVLVGG